MPPTTTLVEPEGHSLHGSDLSMSAICSGFPHLFMRRANPLRIADEESMARSAGPMLAIGACSCLMVRS